MSRVFLQNINKLEKKYTPYLLRIIIAYRKKFISDLKAHGKQHAVNNLNHTLLHPKIALILQDIYKTSGLMGARLTYEEIQRHVTQKEKAGGFGRNERWIAEVQRYLRLHMLSFVQDISDTMRQDILNLLERAVKEGWSIEETVRQMLAQHVVQPGNEFSFTEARARAIARTEIVRAANVGHSVAAADLPYEVEKKWSAADDFRTRPAHHKVNKQTRDEHEPFKVPNFKGKKFLGTYTYMQYPGDATAPPEQTIHCRCRVLYVPKRDSQGNLIMRKPNQARVVPMRRVPQQQIPGIAASLKSQIHIGIED